MNYFQHFLESSTIHGLVYISTESKFARLFWVLVVATGFTIATLLIEQSFNNWSESPIKTTIETRPISEITFPKVTVCPPRNTFTDLNYDLMMLENMTMTNEKRQEFLSIANTVFMNSKFENLRKNLYKIEEENRFYNWYHGYTYLDYPRWTDYSGLDFRINTSATSGSFKSQYFGDNYDPKKIEPKLYLFFSIFPPVHVVKNPNFTLTLEIEKVSMTVLTGNSFESFYVYGFGFLHHDRKILIQNYTAPGEEIMILIKRNVNSKDVEGNRNLKTMPGFSIKWSYNQEVEPVKKWSNNEMNVAYKRYVKILN